MSVFAFRVTLASPPTRLDGDVLDRLFEAGIDGHDEVNVCSRDGKVYVDAELAAAALADAIGSVLARVEKAGYRMAAIEMTEPLGLEEFPATEGTAATA